MTRNRTQSIKTHWKVELFPFDSIYPDAQASPLGGFTGGTASSHIVIGEGVTGVRISRSKESPSGSCVFSVSGPVPQGCFPGTWVIVSSTSMLPNGQPRELMRFIGQIYDMSVDYSVGENAVVLTRTRFSVREWSAALEIPVRWDLFSVVMAMSSGSLTTGLAISSLTGAGGGMDAEKMTKLATDNFNAYEMAQLFLMLVNGISENDKVTKIKNIGAIPLPETAVKLPSVPKALLDRLGLEEVQAENPLVSGFADVITGTQTTGVNNDGTWDGVFDPATPGSPVAQGLAALKEAAPFTNGTIEGYKSSVKKEVTNRPISLGLQAMAGTGVSAWQLITEHCDPSVNEFFTDILYQGIGGEVVAAKPVIFVRDKPFLLKKFKDKINVGEWTLFDDLPRVRVDSVYIKAFSFRNTFINSPNFIRINYQPSGLTAEYVKMQSQLNVVKRPAEMSRFGGQEFPVQTQFISIDVVNGNFNGEKVKNWYEEIRQVTEAWHCFNYRMGSGSLVLMDDNVPLTCGFNVQFKIGQYDLVGHVDAVDINFTIHPDGRHETVTSVRVSRLVHDLDGKLEFIPPDHMANLTYSPPQAIPDPTFEGTGLSALGAIVSAIMGN